jgi:hypothetical protein
MAQTSGMDTSLLQDVVPAGAEKPDIRLYEMNAKSKDQYGEIANEFPYIDWVRVINVCIMLTCIHLR